MPLVQGHIQSLSCGSHYAGSVVIQHIIRNSCDQRVMEYTSSNYCDMFLTWHAHVNQAETASCKYIRYPGWHHPNAKVFRWSEQCLWKTKYLTSPAHVNAGHLQSVQMPATKDAKLLMWNENLWGHMVSQRNWGYHKHWSSMYSMIMNYIHTTINRISISSQTIILYKCSSANACISYSLLTSPMINSNHGLILMLSVHVGIKFTWETFMLDMGDILKGA